MADDPSPPPTKKTKRAVPGLNKAQAEDLSKAEMICAAAGTSPYDTALAARDISSTFVTTLKNDCTACRNTTSSGLQATVSKESTTLDETADRDALLAGIAEVQKAARQKYAETQPVILQDYFIGVRIEKSRAALEQASQAIITKLASDTLPGITTAKKTALTSARSNYTQANVDQADAQGDATGDRTTRDAQLESINQRRRQIQFAADAEWPHTNPASAAARRRFFLPANRTYTG